VLCKKIVKSERRKVKELRKTFDEMDAFTLKDLRIKQLWKTAKAYVL
jgi:hypothetical protein